MRYLEYRQDSLFTALYPGYVWLDPNISCGKYNKGHVTVVTVVALCYLVYLQLMNADLWRHFDLSDGVCGDSTSLGLLDYKVWDDFTGHVQPLTGVLASLNLICQNEVFLCRLHLQGLNISSPAWLDVADCLRFASLESRLLRTGAMIAGTARSRRLHLITWTGLGRHCQHSIPPPFVISRYENCCKLCCWWNTDKQDSSNNSISSISSINSSDSGNGGSSKADGIFCPFNSLRFLVTTRELPDLLMDTRHFFVNTLCPWSAYNWCFDISDLLNGYLWYGYSLCVKHTPHKHTIHTPHTTHVCDKYLYQKCSVPHFAILGLGRDGDVVEGLSFFRTV